MLKWISDKLKQGKDLSDHPLGSEGGIRELLNELAADKPESSLLELIDWIGAPDDLARAMPPEKVTRALVRLDEFGQSKLNACWAQFLAETRVDHLAEQKLKTLDKYYQSEFDAYRFALQLLDGQTAVDASNIRGLQGLFTQRMMLALVGRLRILHIRYRPPDGSWWQNVGHTLTAAHDHGVINLKQRSYPEDSAVSSPWLEYLIALFFEISPLGNLVPQQMDLLYRLLRWLEPHFMVQGTYSTQSPYYIRLDQPAPPKRASEALPADGKLVYFGPGLAYGQLVRLRSTIKNAGVVLDWMAPSQCPADKALAVIDALIMQWSEHPPERRFARERKAAQMHVCHGFTQIRRMVAFSEFARSGRKIGYKTHLEMLKFERIGLADAMPLDTNEEERWQNATPLETVRMLEMLGDHQMIDDWTMQDISKKGVGAIVPFLKPWIVIGAYVGFRIDDEIDWRIGTLRRIHRAPSGHPAAGLEVMAEVPRCAQIQPMKAPASADPWSDMHRDRSGDALLDAIVISITDSLVLIPPGLFDADRPCDLILAGVRAHIRLKSLVHQSSDCDCVQFELIDSVLPEAMSTD